MYVRAMYVHMTSLSRLCTIVQAQHNSTCGMPTLSARKLNVDVLCCSNSIYNTIVMLLTLPDCINYTCCLIQHKQHVKFHFTFTAGIHCNNNIYIAPRPTSV